MQIGQGTIHKYLMESGFLSRKGRRRMAGYKFDLDALIGLYEKDIQRLWGLGIKEMAPQHLACMDSSSLGWRLLARKTYSPKGGTQLKIREGNPAYTNLVVWVTFRTESTDAWRCCSRVIRNLQSDPESETGWTSCSSSTILIKAVSFLRKTRSMWARIKRLFSTF